MPKKHNEAQPFLTDQLEEVQRALELVRVNADAMFSSIGDGAITTDTNGRIEKINQVALDLLGYKREEVLHKWFPSVLVARSMKGEDVPIIERPITQSFLGREPVSRKLFYRHKDGSFFPVAVTVSPIVWNGKPLGAIEVFRDITTDYQMEKIKDDFISIASHQLRTPATGVKQYVGMLLEGYAGKLKKEQVGMLEKAFESNERQLKIVDDLLRVAHLDAGQISLKLEQVDLVQMIDDVIKEQHRKVTAKHQKVELLRQSESVMATVDKARMRMVVENILDNAVKYSPEHSTIQLSVKKGRKKVSITVKDEGIGIAPEDQAKLFQKFSRIHNPASRDVSGSGLGLYWAKQVVDLHDGKITLKSTPGKGTAFTIELPQESDTTRRLKLPF